jgi:hypothetical protein
MAALPASIVREVALNRTQANPRIRTTSGFAG